MSIFIVSASDVETWLCRCISSSSVKRMVHPTSGLWLLHSFTCPVFFTSHSIGFLVMMTSYALFASPISHSPGQCASTVDFEYTSLAIISQNHYTPKATLSSPSAHIFFCSSLNNSGPFAVYSVGYELRGYHRCGYYITLTPFWDWLSHLLNRISYNTIRICECPAVDAQSAWFSDKAQKSSPDDYVISPS